MASTLLSSFIGTDRWLALFGELKRNSNTEQQPSLHSLAVLSAFLIALAPVLITYVDSLINTKPGNLPTLAFGICTLLAILGRKRLGLGFIKTKNWKKSISLTHTAVALGCIPAVMIIVLSPSMLAERHDTLVSMTDMTARPGGQGPSFLNSLPLIIAIAAWVAITEEFIFRGLLLAAIRRWKLIPKQWQRDLFGAVISAGIFGLAHWPTWGPIPALALTGLGVGFVLAYIVNGEQLLPLVIYHFAFDFLSITVGIFS